MDQISSMAEIAQGPEAAPKPQRIDWIDSAKGIGIVLVVIGHTLGGLIDSSLGNGLVVPREAFFLIYTFHMPLFFLLSGLLVSKRVARGTSKFLVGLGPGVVWPYFLWSVIQFTTIYLLGSLVNNPIQHYWPVILSLPWNTVSQFWFLHALFWMHVLAALLLPRIGREGLVFFALVLKSLMLIVALPVVMKLVFNNMLFYAFGVWLMPAGVEALVVNRGRLVRIVLLPVLAALVVAATLQALPRFAADLPLLTAASPEIANLAWRFPAAAAAVLGTFAVIGVASAFNRPITGALAFLGRMSMPIFVLHVLFIAGTRIALIRFGHIDSVAVLLPLLVLAGLIGPLVTERITRSLGLNRWIGF